MGDFCYSRPMLERIFRHAELLDRMMERLGIDAVAAVRLDGGMARYEARTKCIGCCRERQCSEWSAQSAAAAPGEWPEFCCNAEFFRRIATTAPLSSPRTGRPCPSMEERHA